jgi:hypothetical protein
MLAGPEVLYPMQIVCAQSGFLSQGMHGARMPVRLFLSRLTRCCLLPCAIPPPSGRCTPLAFALAAFACDCCPPDYDNACLIGT